MNKTRDTQQAMAYREEKLEELLFTLIDNQKQFAEDTSSFHKVKRAILGLFEEQPNE